MNKRKSTFHAETSVWNFLMIGIIVFVFCACKSKNEPIVQQDVLDKPKIVNIVNFIRLLEPRDPNITEEVLYQTVVEQIKLLKKYHLKATFLLQYDALLDARYQKLLKELSKEDFEIGAWWEIPQPLVENAGMQWRGRYPWDWHADIGFSTGYTPEERERLADVYMRDFKNIFGYYPKSVASWFVDAHTLNYLYEKYDIVASANCKDQFGTDGYTLWGGYWNQAYYPSKINSYMPAQNEKNQIPVPIFRMLGSDPIRQYDTGLDSDRQGVESLEPVYPNSGGNKEWVKWYLNEFVHGEAMEFGYTQAGQENSFTWNGMKTGLEMQFPLIDSLRNENKVKVETLEESGRWFKKHYKVTPATSVTINNDLKGSNKKTVWFNSRFYRANLLWENGTLRFRDIHVFDESLQSPYLDRKVESNQALFFTLPIVDGYLWSSSEKLAGLRFYRLKGNEKIDLIGGDPSVTNPTKGKLHISWPIKDTKAFLVMDIEEKKIRIKMEGETSIAWFLDLDTVATNELPFVTIDPHKITAEFENKAYALKAIKGNFSVPSEAVVFRITPEEQRIELEF
tara:strand:- start:44774 stop:46471 length:1698 start_codon:yes stop_codon:yes gene_type:complete